MSKFSALGMTPPETPSRMPIERLGVPIVDRDGREAYIELLAPDSSAGAAFEMKSNNRRIDQASRKGGRVRLTAEEMIAEQIERFAALTTGWYLVGADGQPLDLPFSKEYAAELYAAEPRIRAQVQAFLENIANFTVSASAT